MAASEPFFSFHYTCLRVNALKMEILFDEDTNFVVDGWYYCALLTDLYFHQLLHQ